MGYDRDPMRSTTLFFGLSLNGFGYLNGITTVQIEIYNSNLVFMTNKCTAGWA